jgi:group I intron endonuclease
MTCGIYILRFNETKSVYVGQSLNIENRFKVHIRKLRDGTHNYKMLKAFGMYGLPTFEIIAECTKSDLNDAELEAFGIFDSVENGFNVASEPDIHLEGESNGASKYTNQQVSDVLNLLVDLDNRYKDISEATGVSISTVRHIANGESHSWLAREYPDKYSILISNRGTNRQSAGNSAKSQGKVYPKVRSPLGIVFEVECANSFARSNHLDSSYFIKLLNGKANSCKGWTTV